MHLMKNMHVIVCNMQISNTIRTGRLRLRQPAKSLHRGHLGRWAPAFAALLAITSIVVTSPTTAGAELAGSTDVTQEESKPESPNASIEWNEARAVQVYRDAAGIVLLEREVIVRVRDSGAYWIHTESLDGSGAAETVAYDGQGTQRVLITEPGGNVSAYIYQSDRHFAVARSSAGTRSISTEAEIQGTHQSATYHLVSNISRVSGPASSLKVEAPSGVVFQRESDDQSQAESPNRKGTSLGRAFHGPNIGSNLSVSYVTGYSVSNARDNSEIRNFANYASANAGGNSATHYDTGYTGVCAYVYNYRNSSTGFFTAYTRRGPACRYVQVSAWSEYVWENYCYDWRGAGSRDRVYSTWSGYFFAQHPNRYACSLHAAWDEDWWMHVRWDYLTAAVRG